MHLGYIGQSDGDGGHVDGCALSGLLLCVSTTARGGREVEREEDDEVQRRSTLAADWQG
jgi:hypothetical protein